MFIDLTNNTSRMPRLQSQQPQTALRKSGLMGVGETESTGSTWQEIQAGINSQLLWFINLDRIKAGQQPLAPQYAAPTVQVQPTQEVKTLAMLGVAGLAGIFLLMASKRGR